MVSFIRKDEDGDFIIAICNFTPEVRQGYRFGVPKAGVYREVFNSDAGEFGGSNVLNDYDIETEEMTWQNRQHSILVTVPPLATIYLEYKGEKEGESSPSSKVIKKVVAAKTKKTADKAEAKSTTTRGRKKASEVKATEEKPKTTRGRKKASEVKETEEKPKATRGRKKASEVKETEEKPKATRGRKKASEVKEPEEKPKATRGRKKASEVKETEEKPKATRTRKTATTTKTTTKTNTAKAATKSKTTRTTRAKKAAE